MQRLDGGSATPPQFRDGVVALGNFDGFHLGHQAVVAQAVKRARASGRPALVATFDPHPVRHFKPDVPPFRLTTLEQRARLFAAAGADAMVVFVFDEALAGLGAEAFVAERLVGLLGVAGVVTGDDFTFGARRGGNVGVLAELGNRYGFTADSVPHVTLDGEDVSSSRIRVALQAGNPREAARLMTRPFAIEGVVQHGARIGRTLGYPTANLSLGSYLRPRYGIYAVRGVLPGGKRVGGVASLGIRPSFEPPRELLEPYFFDWSGDLYGETIEVELIDYLRDEVRFDTLDALTVQMRKDEARARAVL